MRCRLGLMERALDKAGAGTKQGVLRVGVNRRHHAHFLSLAVEFLDTVYTAQRIQPRECRRQ